MAKLVPTTILSDLTKVHSGSSANERHIRWKEGSFDTPWRSSNIWEMRCASATGQWEILKVWLSSAKWHLNLNDWINYKTKWKTISSVTFCCKQLHQKWKPHPHMHCGEVRTWSKGAKSRADINTKEITAVCASMTAALAAACKIFIARAREKLQQQFSPEAGKWADLATLRRRPLAGSGTIIIILLLPTPRFTVGIYTAHTASRGSKPLVATG